MLRRQRALGPALALLGALAPSASAQDDGPLDGIHQPLRITSGTADQLLGSLAPNDRTLYYVSNAEASSSIRVMDTSGGRAKVLFDDGADATWPRVSPNGKRLLYVSYREQATGQLCTRRLPEGDGRECLKLPGAIQAEWIDSSRIVLVDRESLQGGLQLLEVQAGGHFEHHLLVEGDGTGPAVSPDGKWLVYVPVEREVREVGPGFAAHSAPQLSVLRLGAGEPLAQLQVSLPGLTAQPTFSKDGRFLYFTQFLADTNHDGVVDASDSGVLFRLPFPGPTSPAPPAEPEQLSDASWNCQYPSTSKTRLVATCTRSDSLDVFELPLEGEIPETWSSARVALELELAGKRTDQLLLYRRHLRDAKTPAGRHFGLMRMVRLHLEGDEFDAARFYAKAVGEAEDATTAGLGRELQLWVDHRRLARERESGAEVGAFSQLTRQRIHQLEPQRGESPAAELLGHVIRSELADSLGDKALAVKELEAANPHEKTPRALVELYARRADALYRSLDRREPLVAAYRRLADITSLPLDARLGYARASVRALSRGRPYAEADKVLSDQAAREPPDSELAFSLELGRRLLLIRDAKSPGAQESLLALYGAQSRPDRRRALVSDAVGRASEFGADGVIEALAQHYIQDVPPGTAERNRAEILYRHALLGRAFRERAANDSIHAREDFDRVVEHTHSLEALVGSMDLGMRAQEPHPVILAKVDQTSQPPWLKAFAHAYLAAHDLRTLTGSEHARAVDAALERLRSQWADLRRQRLGQALSGAIRHEAYLETNDLDQAERASGNYEVALKGLGSNLRLKAMLLGQLGILQMQVGNYRIALSSLDQREKLPYAENAAGLSVRLARARALLHVGRTEEAADAAEQAVTMIDETPRLADYRILAVDRAALYSLAAGRFEKALARYDALLQLLVKSGSQSTRAPIAARLGHAAAALGARQPAVAIQDLVPVQAALESPDAAQALQWPHASAEDVLRTYRIITSGLQANALQALGRPADAALALERRRDLIDALFKRSDRDDDLKAVALVESRLAEDHTRTGDFAKAAHWSQFAIVHGTELGARSETPLTQEERDALWLAVEVSAFGSVPAPDLASHVKRALAERARRPEGTPAGDTRWMEICLALMAL